MDGLDLVRRAPAVRAAPGPATGRGVVRRVRMASTVRGARDPRTSPRGRDGDVLRARGRPLGEAVRRVPRWDLGAGDARPLEPVAPGVAGAAVSARTRDAVPGRGGAGGHLLDLRAGAQDPARPGRVGLAKRVAAARGGDAHLRTRWLGTDPARSGRALTDRRAPRPHDGP